MIKTSIEGAIFKETKEIEIHMHHFERWFEKAAVASGETHVADRIGTASANGAFQLDGGNDTWGSWVQILGSSDTPVAAGMTKFDVNEIDVVSTEKAAIYFIQFGFGATGAAALAAGDVAEEVFVGQVGRIHGSSSRINSKTIDAGTKAWARCLCDGEDTGTIDLYFGIHEYEG